MIVIIFTISSGCLAIGIVLLIASPVSRVAIIMAVFFLDKDYCYAAIAGAVFVIITVGFPLGTMNSHRFPIDESSVVDAGMFAIARLRTACPSEGHFPGGQTEGGKAATKGCAVAPRSPERR